MRGFLPEKINKIITTLQSHGFDAYAVGGCVRDLLRGVSPHDYDVTTDALPDDVQRIFKKTVSTGIKHGTVTVLSEGEPVEVTTFRTENTYSDCRRPDKVQFVTDIRQDLSRRDFTVNAMAYNDGAGLVDCFGGKEDLSRGVLRAVGDPETRFLEDALRILRLFRFCAVLNFTPETQTLDAALSCSPLLAHISRERISVELQKAVCGQNIVALEPLLHSGALGFLGITQDKPLLPLSTLPPKGNIRFFSFLSACCCDLPSVLCALKCSNALKEYCRRMLLLCNGQIPKDKPSLKRLLRQTGINELDDYLVFLSRIRGEDNCPLSEMTAEILQNKEPYLIKHLAVGGNELKDIGISGSEIGNTLMQLLDAVTDNPALNNSADLIALARKNKRTN